LRSICGAAQIKGSGEEDGILNYINYECIMSQIWVNIPKCGHVIRMDNNKTTKRMSDTRPEGKRGIRRIKLRGGIV
jgi:hypothetical protein